jgi:hypothetical protein
LPARVPFFGVSDLSVKLESPLGSESTDTVVKGSIETRGLAGGPARAPAAGGPGPGRPGRPKRPGPNMIITDRDRRTEAGLQVRKSVASAATRGPGQCASCRVSGPIRRWAAGGGGGGSRGRQLAWPVPGSATVPGPWHWPGTVPGRGVARPGPLLRLDSESGRRWASSSVRLRTRQCPSRHNDRGSDRFSHAGD